MSLTTPRAVGCIPGHSVLRALPVGCRRELRCCHLLGPWLASSWGADPRLWRAGSQASSSYCVRKGLIRKAHLAHNLKKWAAKHPGGLLAGAVPETFVLEVDDVEYIDEALSDLPEVCTSPAQQKLRELAACVCVCECHEANVQHGVFFGLVQVQVLGAQGCISE